ncbi:MAG: peptidylprolyl isomerase [Chloroflexota bacterium]|nr:peptidylprolyl isomerase [Chloroflexota bacterium]
MTEENLTVADGLLVSLDYVLHLDDGTLVDSSDDQADLEFVQGQGQIMPGLERALYGMTVGDEKSVVVAPPDGYGERDPEAFRAISSEEFSPEMALKRGAAIHMRDEEGRVVVAFVADVRPGGVLLDFNHPLAGQTLHFRVRVSALRAPA